CRGPSDLPAVDPVVKADTGGLLDLLRAHRLERIDGDEVVSIPVGREALEEGGLHDVVLAVAARSRQRLGLDAFEGLDDRVLPGPRAATGFRRTLDGGLERHYREVAVVGLVVRPLLELLVMPAREFLGQGTRLGMLEVEAVVAEDRALGREVLLERLVHAATCSEDELRRLREAGGMRL